MLQRAFNGGTIVLRARRDTVALILVATAATFALAQAIHSRPGFGSSADHPIGWTGDLAEVSPPPPAVPFTSASLVVPAAELALPKVAVRPLVRLHPCGAACAPKAIAPSVVAVAARRPLPPAASTARPSSATPLAVASARPKSGVPSPAPTLMSRLNPLKHLPDMSRVSRPFTVAGDTVTGWFKRF